MAKSDSFFLRAAVTTQNDSTYDEISIDLGAYVDALGKSVLRIHNIAVSITDTSGTALDMTAGKAAVAQFQLCTQTQLDTVLPTNKSIVASGMINAFDSDGSGGVAGTVSDQFDNLPQLWTNGYLIAVDTMYLGGEASAGWAEDVTISLVLECTVETMSKAAAMALALSQQ